MLEVAAKPVGSFAVLPALLALVAAGSGDGSARQVDSQRLSGRGRTWVRELVAWMHDDDPEYRTVECRDGRPLELDPASPVGP